MAEALEVTVALLRNDLWKRSAGVYGGATWLQEKVFTPWRERVYPCVPHEEKQLIPLGMIAK
jgi:hypothetical protein